MNSIRKFISVLMWCFILAWQISPVAAEIYMADGHQIEVTLVPEKSVIMLGEPAYLSFIVRNHSALDLQVLVGGDYRNSLGRPNSFKVTVTNADGKPVVQPHAGMNFGGLFGPQKIPAKGNYIFELFLPHWATFEETGNYSIVANRTLTISKYTPERWDSNQKRTNVPAQVSAKIEIVPQDKEKMGKIISALGEAMLGGDTDKAESAAFRLSYIEDERVIPYFVKALEKRNYSQKFTALMALAKFNNDAAFQALKKGMDTQGKDMANTPNTEVANQLADNIRDAAAAALSRSPHPDAIPFLLTRRHDTAEGVRLTILHVLGKMKPAEAIPILQEMAGDKSQRVSDEAKRYLKLLSDPK